jgi:toxin HigB-1
MALQRMIIESITHKMLRRFVEHGNAQGLMEVERLRDMIAFIVNASAFDELAEPPNFGFHPLKGNRRGYFAMAVTRNWRLTFAKIDDQTIGALDLEDYH